jgi:hypothetical protein
VWGTCSRRACSSCYALCGLADTDIYLLPYSLHGVYCYFMEFPPKRVVCCVSSWRLSQVPGAGAVFSNARARAAFAFSFSGYCRPSPFPWSFVFHTVGVSCFVFLFHLRVTACDCNCLTVTKKARAHAASSQHGVMFTTALGDAAQGHLSHEARQKHCRLQA